jgi:hypothetical protein
MSTFAAFELLEWPGWLLLSASLCVLGALLGIWYGKAVRSRKAGDTAQSHRDFPRP